MDPKVEPSTGSAADNSAAKRLDSWKEIAAYLGRGVTTVQRWEQEEGLPVHRLAHAKRGSVFAFRSEIEAWRLAHEQSKPERAAVDAESVTPGGEDEPERPAQLSHRFWLLTVGLVGFIALTLAVARIHRFINTQEPNAETTVPSVPKPLANDAALESYPSLSPDGSRVVYVSRTSEGAADLYVKMVTGGPAQRMWIRHDGRLKAVHRPKWSPNPDLIAFVGREATDRYGLYLVSPSGGQARRLTAMSGVSISWASDGRSIAFVDRNSDSEPFSIFSISIETAERRRLTTPPLSAFGDTTVALSPDGRRFAFARFGTRHDSDLYVADTGQIANAVRLTYGFSGIHGIEWTSDGGTVVFGSHTGLWRISARPATGETPLLITGIPGGARHPTISRPSTGRSARLVYEYERRDVNVWRWDAAPDGSGTMKKLPGSTWWEDHPALSPDGRHVAFASNRTGTNEIWIAKADGSSPRQVTFHRGPVVISPAWSPDSQRLAFCSQIGGNRDIYVIDRDGSNSTRLTFEPSQEENPSWSRDGRWIYFRSDRSSFGQVWKVGPGGGSAIRVTTGEASQAFESPDGRLLYFVRGMGVPGVWSVPTEGGRETFLLPDVREALWGVADTGIYFIVSAPELSPAGPTLRFYSFAKKEVSTLTILPSKPNEIGSGFSVGRDGRSALWAHMDELQQDLMLIDPWRP